MSTSYNVYCDESCHLENDGQPMMILGAVWLPQSRAWEANVRLREIKKKHGFPAHFEIKWTKVSASKKQFYMEVVDYFFAEDDLHFRAVVAPKDRLNHSAFNQDHDKWYYKMYFTMLKNIFTPDDEYRVYLDIKDTRSRDKLRELHNILCNDRYDFSKSIITSMQHVRSEEINVLQLANLLIGAVGYVNRGLAGNAGKEELVRLMRERSRLTLTRSTLMRAQKVNILKWEPQGMNDEQF